MIFSPFFRRISSCVTCFYRGRPCRVSCSYVFVLTLSTWTTRSFVSTFSHSFRKSPPYASLTRNGISIVDICDFRAKSVDKLNRLWRICPTHHLHLQRCRDEDGRRLEENRVMKFRGNMSGEITRWPADLHIEISLLQERTRKWSKETSVQIHIFCTKYRTFNELKTKWKKRKVFLSCVFILTNSNN